MSAVQGLTNKRGESTNESRDNPECAVCHGNDWVSVSARSLPWLSNCGNCGMQRVFPVPATVELDEIYGKDYFRRFGAAEKRAAYETMKRENAANYLEQIAVYSSSGSLLDVGCGLGENLVVGKERDWQVFGVDRNEFAIRFCNESVFGSATVLDWERESWIGPQVDLVMFCDVIEHFLRPDEALRRANNSLRQHGLIFLTTPNVESIWARLLGHRWWHYHIDHLWYFSRKALCQLAENAGFEVLMCGPTKKRFALRYIVSILAHSEKHVRGKWLSSQLLRFLPDRVLAIQLPPIKEGLTLIARKVGS